MHSHLGQQCVHSLLSSHKPFGLKIPIPIIITVILASMMFYLATCLKLMAMQIVLQNNISVYIYIYIYIICLYLIIRKYSYVRT